MGIISNRARPYSFFEIDSKVTKGLRLDRHLSIVANGFRAAGFVLGVPSIAALLFLSWAWISLRPGHPLVAPTTDIGKYGLIALLSSGAYGVGKVFEFFGGATRWVAGMLAVLSFCTTLFSASLFYTGRGLMAHALWARLAGGILTFGLLLLSFAGMMSLPRGGAWISVLFAGLATYAMWVLGWRFS